MNLEQLIQDIETKHIHIGSGAKAIGMHRNNLYDILKRIKKTGKIRLSTSLVLARILGISYPQFQKRYLQSNNG